MSLNTAVIDTIRGDWTAAPSGCRTDVMARWSDRLGCSLSTLYRKLEIGRSRKGGRRINNIEACAEIIAQVKRKPPVNMGEITTEQAVRIAVKNKLIPGDMTGRSGTFDRVMREMGYSKKRRRFCRFQAEYPNQMHHVDASTSQCFYIHRPTSDKKDYVMRLHSGSKTGYKNKPIPVGLRPWVYGLVDDHSGCHVARYVAAAGETALDNLDFLQWAWSKNDDTALFGLPDKLKGDLGPMMRGPAGKDFFKRLGVEIDPSIPENKESHGKIERPWRTAWQRFEKPFFVQNDWKNFEILMSELNRRFYIYQAELNDRPHRYEKTLSRKQAWLRINARGGAVAIPENAMATIARRYDRTVGVDGCFSLGGTSYEVKGLHDAKVYVYQGVFDGCLVVQDKASGGKYAVATFTPLPVGTYKASPQTPHQTARKDAVDLAVTNTLYTTKTDDAVPFFPTRIQPPPKLANPMAVDAYACVSVAMADFVALSGVVPDADNRAVICRLIDENGLDRAFVRDLAMEVRSENERSVSNG